MFQQKILEKKPRKLPKAALEIRKNGRQQKIAIIYVSLDGSSAAKISMCFLLFQLLKVTNKC